MRKLIMITFLLLPTTTLAASALPSLGGSAASSTIQTESPQQPTPQTTTLQPVGTTADQQSSSSAITILQGATPDSQQTLQLEGEGVPQSLPSSSSSLRWLEYIGLAGLFVLAGFMWWFGSKQS